jgi:hypothetical protein
MNTCSFNAFYVRLLPRTVLKSEKLVYKALSRIPASFD